MRNFLAIGFAMAVLVSAGPVMAQSCCSGGATTPNFGGSAVQPVQNYSSAHYSSPNYSAPIRYRSPVSNRAFLAPRAYAFPVAQAQPSYWYGAPIPYSARRMTSTYSSPRNINYSGIASRSLNSMASGPMPVYTYSAPPAVSSSPKSAGGCGCGCAKTGSCGCGH